MNVVTGSLDASVIHCDPISHVFLLFCSSLYDIMSCGKLGLYKKFVAHDSFGIYLGFNSPKAHSKLSRADWLVWLTEYELIGATVKYEPFHELRDGSNF